MSDALAEGDFSPTRACVLNCKGWTGGSAYEPPRYGPDLRILAPAGPRAPRGDRRSNWELPLVTSWRGRRDCGRVVRQHAQLREQGGKSDVAVEHLDLAVAQVPEVGGREVDPGPRRLDRAGGRLERPEESTLDRQLDADHVAAHGDLLQLPVNVGKELAQKDDQTAQLRTPQAILAVHTADAVEHTVRCEQIPKPLGVQGITLAIVVRLQDDREVGLLTLGQVTVGERQRGRRDWRGVGQGGGRRLVGQYAPGQHGDRGDGREGRAAREERTAVRGGHGDSLRWAGRVRGVDVAGVFGAAGHEDLLEAARGEVQHLLSAGCLHRRPQYHRRTGERPLPDSGDSRRRGPHYLSASPRSRGTPTTASSASSTQPGARAAHVGRGLIGRHDRVATLDCAAGKPTTIISAPAGSGKTSVLHAGVDRSDQDPDHNHQDPVTTVHPPGGEPGSVAEARTAAREVFTFGSDLREYGEVPGPPTG